MPELGKPIDWRSIPEIASDIEFHKNNRENGVGQAKECAEWFRDEDHVYLLKVKVTDVDLAQAVLQRGFAPPDGSLIPGFSLEEIVLNPEGNEKQKLAAYLRARAEELDPTYP